MNGGEVVVETLLSRGVEAVFFVPGGTNVTVLEALSRNQNKIRSIPTRLESSAVFAADAYSAIRKKPAVVICSRAPGATNASIGTLMPSGLSSSTTSTSRGSHWYGTVGKSRAVVMTLRRCGGSRALATTPRMLETDGWSAISPGRAWTRCP